MATNKTTTARKRTKKEDAAEQQRLWSEKYAKNFVETEMGDEISNSMSTYTSYTLTERALSYIDGMKPAHRRILWTMWKRGYKSNASYTKSATVAGAVMELHPHGSTYGVIANLTRSKADDTKPGACLLNLCLIDGHGNFGTSYGDGSAADRYTEVRLSKTGESCTEDIARNAVFMVPSHDAQNIEPEIMPVRLPLLLINGNTGLTYGYNVSWLPHNPSEAIEACLYRLSHPKCSVEDIMKIMPGPDFSCGGIIVDNENNGIEAGYETGFGQLTVTSRYKIEEGNRGKHTILFTEAPYGVKRSSDDGKSILDGIKKFAFEHPEYGITDEKDLSDKENDCLIEVSIKSGIDPETVARALLDPSNGTRLTVKLAYRQSAIVNDWIESDVPDVNGIEKKLRLANVRPADIGVLEYLDRFLEFRRVCITNSCRYTRDDALRRKHLLDGLLAALLDIDAVIAVVRSSQNKDTAAKNLKKKFKLDDDQAQYILALTLSRLTRSDRIKIEGDSKKLADLVKKMEKILSTKAGINGEVRRELEEELERQTLPRRTTIVDAKGKIKARAAGHPVAEVKNVSSIVLGTSIQPASKKEHDNKSPINSETLQEECFINIEQDGKVVRTSEPKKGTGLTIHAKNASDQIMVVFADGDSERLHAFEISEKGELLGKTAIGVTRADCEKAIMVTKHGKIKCLDMATLTKAPNCQIMNLDQNDSLIYAGEYDDNARLVMISEKAMLLAIDAAKIPVQGRTSGGVKGMTLKENDRIICAKLANDNQIVLTSTGTSVKKTKTDEFPTKGRGTGGVRCHAMRKGESILKSAAIGHDGWVADGKKNIEVPFGKRDGSGTLSASNAVLIVD